MVYTVIWKLWFIDMDQCFVHRVTSRERVLQFASVLGQQFTWKFTVGFIHGQSRPS
jgi:hypothetical protein